MSVADSPAAAADVTNRYDEVAYPSSIYADTLPAVMAVHAHLRGRPYEPFSRARVLEIGCNNGANLLSMAAMAPDARFVGFDLAAKPVAEGQRMAAAAGLANVTLMVGDILDPAVVDGEFDYVIAHGIYAWVPAPVREGVLALMGRVLKPAGLAFLSYNVMPGCAIRVGLRSVLRDAMETAPAGADRLASALETLAFFEPAWKQLGPFGEAVSKEALRMRQSPSHLVFHDELSEVYEPQLLGDVVAAARARGLDYIADSQPVLSRDAFFPEGALDELRYRAGGDWIRYEQLKDILTLNLFRQSLLCRAGVPVLQQTDWSRLRPLYAEGSFAPKESGKPGSFAFTSAKGTTIETEDASFARIIEEVGHAFPAAVALENLVTSTAAGTALLKLFVAGMLRLRTEPGNFAGVAGERPEASPLARVQAAAGVDLLSNLRHVGVANIDAAGRHLITLADGTRTRPEIAAALAEMTGTPLDTITAALPGALESMAKMSLLVA